MGKGRKEMQNQPRLPKFKPILLYRQKRQGIVRDKDLYQKVRLQSP